MGKGLAEKKRQAYVVSHMRHPYYVVATRGPRRETGCVSFSVHRVILSPADDVC